jgi:hypothetical protein|tara:strand:- start:61 stop:255 length:195 start_codon:yes stop_codon:yes gene_type:complete
MASMIEHSNFISVHELKQQWEDDIVAEDEEKIKMGLTKRCMNCHKAVATCDCIGHTLDSTYWGY